MTGYKGKDVATKKVEERREEGGRPTSTYRPPFPREDPISERGERRREKRALAVMFA